MKTELEKCLSDEWYDCHAPVFMRFKEKMYELLLEYSSLSYDYKEERYALLKEMSESVGKKVSIGHSFICDYGCSINIGNNVNINAGCTFVDCDKIIISNNVLIIPSVQAYTVTHPVESNERLILTETGDGTAYIRHTYVLPVIIENGRWIDGGTIILPGVTIGQGSAIGTGNIVTKSVLVNNFAVENPCKAVREINISI